MTEHELMNAIRVALSRGDARLFRQQVGVGWVGKTSRLTDGSLLIQQPRPLHAGFAGLSDLGGWQTVTVTPDMVGKRIAVYSAIEVKAPRGRVTDEQQAFLDWVARSGGAAGVARSVDDAKKILTSACQGV